MTEETELPQNTESPMLDPETEIQKVQEKQPAMLRVAELVAQDSRWTRSTVLSPTCEITSKETEGRTYQIEVVTDPESPELKLVQDILVETFSAAEVDPIEYLQAGVKGERVGGRKDVAKYQVYVIKDKGEVVALYTGGTLSLKDNTGLETGEMVLMGAYAVTVGSHLRQGLARELYTSALIGALQEAESQGKKLVGVIGETTTASEKAWESVKRGRVYVEDKSPDGVVTRTEVPYVQPALDFDDTGLPEEGTGESPEHLMVDSFGQSTFSKEKLLAMVRAMYEWCILTTKEDYMTTGLSDEVAETAYRNNLKYVTGFENEFDTFLQSHGELVLMNSKERDAAIAQGITVQGHAAADEE